MSALDTQTLKMVLACPYCREQTVVSPAENFAPVYAHCQVCGKRFIVERIEDGVEALKVEGAPACSDPDRREIEMGAGQED